MRHQGIVWILALLASLALPWPVCGHSIEPVGINLGKRIKVVATPFKLDRKTGQYSAKATLANRAQPKQTLYGPLSLVATATSPPGLALENATGQTAAGQSYLVVQLASDGLKPGKKIKNVELRFANPGKSVKARYVVFGLLTPNQAPVAEAGADRTVFVGNAIVLDGSASTDADGQPLTYRWQLLEKPAASHANLTAVEGLKSGFTVDAPGTYRARLVVNDRIVHSAPDVVAIGTENSKPVAHAGPDQSALVGTAVTLDGSRSSDADGDPLSFRWTLGGAALSGETSPHPSFMLDQPGHYTAQLVVNDGKADSDPDTVDIDTRNSQPLANAGPDQADKPVGLAVTLDGSASSDADRDGLAYRWFLLSRPLGSTAALVDANAPVCGFVPDLPGDYVAQLIVNDGKLDSVADTATVAAVVTPPPGNHNPVISSAAPAIATVGQTYRYAVAATDEDGDALAYALAVSPAGMAIDAASGLVQWMPGAGQVGNQAATVQVSDGKGGLASQDFTVAVSAASVPRTTVPTLIGIARAAAEAAAQQARLNLGAASFRHDATVAEGIVLDQSLAAGGEADVGATIALTVSLGPDTGLPPDPVTVAPPVDPTVATTLADSTQFLYSGPNAAQTGVAEGTIEAKRAAVIRGKVLDKLNNPLAGVAVRVKDHPEFGQTLSRADGQFDLAVNGGGLLTLDYRKSGFLPAHRQVNAPWQDYAMAEDAVLIALDTQVTAIDLAASAPMQVARGSVVADSDGTRQATLMIPQGTTARVYNTDGSLRDVSVLNLHLTEYTVGDNGPATMPAPLPPSSGYTYAVELKAEEGAVKLNGKDVLFDRPVPFYVDNFLDFPVGTAVPVGYYDRDRQAWIPSQNGRVIKILSVTDGLADVDGDGDGVADGADQLAALGLTDAERQQLAATYTAGKSLWRVRVTHLSTWDCNWPYKMPDDAVAPTDAKAEASSDTHRQDTPLECRSIIECENQVLGEALPITGSPYTLNYRSNRVPGRKTNRLIIKLSGDSLPISLKRIDLQIEIAGRRFDVSKPPETGQSYVFEWDGLDAYGRMVQGSQPVKIRVGYAYAPVYAVPAEIAAAFGRFSGVPLEGSRARNEVRIFRDLSSSMAGVDERTRGLGAWALDIHHFYDPVGKVLYYGDGDQKSAHDLAAQGNIIDSVSEVAGVKLAASADGSLYVSGLQQLRAIAPDGAIRTVAGKQTGGASCGDGGAATEVNLSGPLGIALDGNRNIYIADAGLVHCVRRISQDGNISRFAGIGGLIIFSCVSSDEVAATKTEFCGPNDIAVDVAGNVYIADSGDHRIRWVTPVGIITTVAGNGQQGYGGDGGLAIQANLNFPSDVSVDSMGNLYIADVGNHRIRRVTPDGLIVTVAGNGNKGYGGDGGPAIKASLSSPSGIAIGNDGSLYIADSGNNRIRRVSPQGIITTIAGNGKRGYTGDGGPATSASLLDLTDVAVDPDGNVYVAEDIYHPVRRFRPLMPGFDSGDFSISSEDGTQLYHFNPNGKHLHTYDTLTGTVLYTFDYDSFGHLAQVTDAVGKITKIEHDALGKPTALIAPYGERTEFTTDDQGFLTSATNSLGETYRMAYSVDGLLASFQTPNGNQSKFAYDDRGRLLSDTDAAGATVTLAKTETADGYQATFSSALSHDTVHEVQFLPTGDFQRTDTLPDSTQTVTLKKTDGTTQVTAADGTVATLLEGPDPRLGMMAPVAKSLSVATGGLTANLSEERTVKLSDPADPLSLTQLAETLTLNGRKATSVYDAASRTVTATSPAGRKSTATINTLGLVTQAQLGSLLPVAITYDGQGRPAQLTQGSDPEARTLSLSYNAAGYLDSVTDPLGRKASFAYGAAGRVTTQTLPDGRVIQYAYDRNGNLTSLTPPGKPAHAFRYTAIDQMAEYIPPDVGAGSNSTVYTYDRDRNPVRIDRPDGQSVSLEYDSAGRPTKLSLGTAPAASLLDSYAYGTATGKLATVATGDGQGLNYTYNQALLTGVEWTGAITGKLSASYDNDFRVTSLSVNGADAIAYGYDSDSLPTQAGALSLTRDAQTGFLSGSSLGKVMDSYAYSGFGELSAYEAKIGGVSAFKASFTRDRLGRITHKVEAFGLVTNTYDYAYDDASRLKEVKLNGTVTASYTYDSNGNRLTAPNLTGSAVYDDQDRLLSYGATTYTYTANGELAGKTLAGLTTQYQYDVLGNLKQVLLPGGTTLDYLVDGRNRRIGKKVGGILVQGFLYQDQLKPIAELDGNNAVVSRFVYATHANVPDYLVKGGVTYRIVTDYLGSPRLVVNTADGSVVQRMDYDEWGNVVGDTNPGFQPFGFAGGLYDRDTGLVRLGARDYDSSIGRWSSKDVVLFDGGLNTFGYAIMDPVNGKDISGFDPDFISICESTDVQTIKNVVPHLDGIFVIAGHGNKTGLEGCHGNNFGPSGINDLKNHLTKNGYKMGMPVAIFACNVGVADYAKKLANELGAAVIAPDGYVVLGQRQKAINLSRLATGTIYDDLANALSPPKWVIAYPDKPVDGAHTPANFPWPLNPL